MTRQHAQLAVTITAGMFLLIAVLLFAGNAAQPAMADTVPTPVAIMNQSQSAVFVTFLDEDTTATDAGGTGIQLYTYEYCNLQYTIDQVDGEVPNTTTLKVQWSMDDTIWSDGPNIVAANAADADGIVQVPNLGRYQRIYEDHTGESPITVTVKALCK